MTESITLKADYDAEGNGMIRVHDWREIVEIIDRMESNTGHRNG